MIGDNPLLAKINSYVKHNKNIRAFLRYEEVPKRYVVVVKSKKFFEDKYL